MNDPLDLPTTPELPDRLRIPLLHDLAGGLRELEDLGQHYGLGGEQGLRVFLAANPEFKKEAATLRALNKSDMSVQDRGRTKAAHASEELIVDIAAIAANPANAAPVRIDAFKQLNRMAGIDGIANTNKNSEGATGTPFNLIINLPDGKTERLTTVVESPTTALPAPDDSEE
jgi:hypothetical protein